MNLAAQIQAAARTAPPPAAPHPRLKNLLLGGPAQSAKALKQYHSAMAGGEWMTQRQIEGRLGYASTVATGFLNKLLADGKVERRNRDGAPVYARRRGYEWRWKMPLHDLFDEHFKRIAMAIVQRRERMIEDALISGAFLNELSMVIPNPPFLIETTPTADGSLHIVGTDLARLK